MPATASASPAFDPFTILAAEAAKQRKREEDQPVKHPRPSTPGLYAEAAPGVFFPFTPSTGEALPLGTYIVRQSMEGLFLARQPDLAVPSRVYGPHHEDRIIPAYQARAADGKSTGVWLNGEKGSGKTMLAAQLSEEMRKLGLSTILLQTPLSGPELNTLVQHISQACFIFDEFEKVYEEQHRQDDLLTLFAGAVQAKHLYVLTTNKAEKVSDAMRNRPGRMRYFIDYHGVSAAVVEEYLAANMKDTARHQAMTIALSGIDECNFDIMQAAVEEHNRFGGSVTDMLALMNIRRNASSWDVTFTGRIRRAELKKYLLTSITYGWKGDLLEAMQREDNPTVCISFTDVGPGKESFTWGVYGDVENAVVDKATGEISMPVVGDADGTLVFKPCLGFSKYRQEF